MVDQRRRQLDQDEARGRYTAQVLATKLYVPPARTNAIARPHLITKLLTGVGRPSSFTLLSGPAGFGKTTLLGEFLAQYRQPAAWVSLDAGDNDPARFWTYVIRACQAFAESIGESALELLEASQRLPDETIPTLLINDLAMQDRSILLVLDDYHVIQDRAIQSGILFLLDHLPPTLHIIISTRTDPPFPLARFRARNQLIEIRAQDLRFSGDEATQFLNQTMGLRLSAEDVVALEERTEGWIAGLQLAALSLQGREDVTAFIRAFTGSHVYVAEYLMEEILQKQPEAIERFLLLTSALDRMNAGLSEAVTECQDGQAILTELHRANSFIIPLDNEGHWFRYHHLFADLLRARLSQYCSAEAIAALHQRAADWYEAHGFVSEAIRHALQAKDFERAASLVDEAGRKRIFTEQNTLLAWLDALPDAVFQTHPRLEIYRVLLALSTGKLDMAEQTLREKEALIKALPPSPENDRLRLEAMVYLSLFVAHQNTTRAIQMAQATLAELPDGAQLLRAFVYSALYRAYGMEGNIDLSAPAYEECLRLAQAAGQYGMVSVTTMVRAFDLCQYGRLDEAAHYCRVILDAGTRLGRNTFYSAGPSHIGLAGIYLEWNELEAAEQHLIQGIELCRQTGSDGLYTGYLQRARLRQAKGDLEGALDELQLLEQTFGRWDFTFTIRQVSVCLARHDVAGVSRLVGPVLDILGDSLYAQRLPLIASEAFKLSLARIYLAQGEIAQCSRVLDEVQATVEPGQRFGRLMEVYLLRALAEQRRQAGHVTAETIGYLERALTLAASAGFVLLILEEGPALIPLLEAVQNHRAVADGAKHYARQLLTAFASTGQFDTGPLPGKVPGLVEMLTPREMEVLLLIATGDSNQVIADKLVITVRTVKKHTTNILGKLDATNRTQAVARARELGLIPSD